MSDKTDNIQSNCILHNKKKKSIKIKNEKKIKIKFNKKKYHEIMKKQ